MTRRAFTAKLPVVNPTLIGREKELAFLDESWAGGGANFVQIVAAGGAGKTALVDKWFRRHLGEADFFGWSFYSQTSSDSCFAELLAWLHIEIPRTASIYAKAEAVANRLGGERVLLLLDGMEPLQDSTGALSDKPLQALLQELAAANRGLAICTTRMRLDIPGGPPRVFSLDLHNLTPEQGAEYLRGLGVQGTGEELQQTSREYGNHALALTLLGTCLADFRGADVRRRVEIPMVMAGETHARRVIGAYDRMFAGKPELDILRALGYFDRPAEPAALQLVLPEMEDRTYRAALEHLHHARLILTTDPAQPLDCHPAISEYFEAGATPEGHARLYEHYMKQAPPLPDTLEEMTPLFYAIYHGCRAGRYEEALTEAYFYRILRGNEFYLTRKLGASGTEASLLASFFERPWTQPAAALSPKHQVWVVSQAGSTLRALGRLADAAGPMRIRAQGDEAAKDWENAAVSHGNLCELHLALGNVAEAVARARQAVDFADRSGDPHQRSGKRAKLADALHQSGALVEARLLFAEAEWLQAEEQPEYPILYSVRGYQYCDLLLEEGQTGEVLRRASQTLGWEQGRLLDTGLDHLSLGRAYRSGSAQAAQHLDKAVDLIRRSGQLDELPRALLARGTDRDLDEVFRIAIRSGMRLYLADYHLAKGNLAEAERLIHDTGYHRRDARAGKAPRPTLT